MSIEAKFDKFYRAHSYLFISKGNIKSILIFRNQILLGVNNFNFNFSSQSLYKINSSKESLSQFFNAAYE